MKVTGSIAEYNPVHNGHRYHIEQAKKVTGADYIVVMMSGDFTQRGTPACFDKFTRAKMALQNGADLVLELPVCYATSSAETFAEGGVFLLNQTGIIDYLCFGAEPVKQTSLPFESNLNHKIATFTTNAVTNQTSNKENSSFSKEALSAQHFLQTAAFFINESIEYKSKLKEYLKAGHSFPTARNLAATPFLSETEAQLLASPNNLLGLEYCKALIKKNSAIKPIPITRSGAGYHDTTISATEFASASAIRKELQSSFEKQNPISENLKLAIPASVVKQFQTNPFLYMTEKDFYPLLYYRLLYEDMTPDYFLDFSKELTDRLKKAPLPPSYETLVDYLKTKQYTRTRIERALLHVLLQITTTDFQNFRENGTGYLRILGFRKDASPLLKALQNNASLPVITKLSDAKKHLPTDAYAMLSHDIRAARLYNAQVYHKYQVLLRDEYAYLVIL